MDASKVLEMKMNECCVIANENEEANVNILAGSLIEEISYDVKPIESTCNTNGNKKHARRSATPAQLIH